MRYAEWKATQVGSMPILQFTGAMARSFRTRRMTNTTLEWGSNSRYAIFHQRGTYKMPQRKVVELDANERRAAMKELQKFLVRQGYPGQSGL
jgi:phage gpG-like protein